MATVHPLPDNPSENPELSARQVIVLQTIIDTVAKQGFPPAMRDLLNASGLSSVSSIAHQLSALEKLGYIKRGSNKARGMEVLRNVDGSAFETNAPSISTNDESTVSIPLLGQIAAGTGLIAEQNIENTMSLPREITGFGDLFMLQVRGDSMIDAGIFDGDYVVVRQQATANNGEIVAALINDEEATVKTFKKRDGQVWLMPHNPDFEPIDGNNAQIMGIVVTVMRKL
ncbi:MAG: transcriptional repressor LexA [Actinomycetota bacterium]|jgi:repressor LexA